ncbi:MAG: endolytic transglycosylase MltG [Desulfobulbaceae bacterium]|nr:endolytic transglycosylase MltG [Desulfobulbaceae bacterium]
MALKKWWLSFLAGLFVLLAGGGVWFWLYPDQPGPVARNAAGTVEIPPGTSLLGIKDILSRAGVIRDDIRFVLLVKWQGDARHLQAGEYAFAPRVSPREVIRQLVSGKTVRHSITVPEGFTLNQVAAVIAAGGWGSGEDLLRLTADPRVVGAFGLRAATLEGYLFPDTYFFAKGTPLRTIISAMVQRMLRVLAEEQAKAALGAGSLESKKVELSAHEVIILASIVEKETALARERPLVARVFLNRLRLGMKLQTDPTVIYGLGKFGVSLTRDDLNTPSPYNTYVNDGLPVGPICNPGRAAISAVLNPATVDYTYFVSQNDGSHYFSKSLNEHNRAVARYRTKKEAAQAAEQKK